MPLSIWLDSCRHLWNKQQRPWRKPCPCTLTVYVQCIEYCKWVLCVAAGLTQSIVLQAWLLPCLLSWLRCDSTRWVCSPEIMYRAVLSLMLVLTCQMNNNFSICWDSLMFCLPGCRWNWSSGQDNSFAWFHMCCRGAASEPYNWRLKWWVLELILLFLPNSFSLLMFVGLLYNFDAVPACTVCMLCLLRMMPPGHAWSPMIAVMTV